MTDVATTLRTGGFSVAGYTAYPGGYRAVPAGQRTRA